MAAADIVSLVVAGKAFAGWTDVDVEVGIDALSGAFRMAFTERWPGQPTAWEIEPGDACEVWIGDDQVMTGWIDRRDAAVTVDSHRLEVTGREKTCDLVDCSAIHRPGSWTGRRLEQIAADLAAPFGIAVTALVDTGAPFARFALQQGETVFDAIERMTRQRGVLPVTTAAGDLAFIRPGEVQAGYGLTLGENLESVSFANDVTDRFSAYHLKGEAADASRPSARAADPGVRRHRPLLIVNDDDSTTAGLGERARWEATVRAGQGQTATGEVSGWRDQTGALYRPDRLVPLKAGLLGLDATLLVASVRYSRGDQGSRSTLGLTRKEAYSLLAIPEPSAARRSATTPPGDA
ncbi:phage baseplate assembly protein [Reyranella sp.]|uniref:phage baseplate assembly protein n=1 Tax=Reyranella sp. TaxID=1929291 RepID=UPI002730FFBA|nr:hypothetical protein [Reyranella sp.]MDP2375305.1 hypothetical protein [Reyranella sp.]